MRRALSSGALCLLVALTPGCGGGLRGAAAVRDIHVAPGAVGGDGTSAHPFASLPEAIGAADAGDRVLVAAGEYTYAADVVLKPGVTIEGEGAATTRVVGDIVDASDSVLPVALRKIAFHEFRFGRGPYTASPTGTVEVTDCRAAAVRFVHASAPSEDAPGYRMLVARCTLTEGVYFLHGAGRGDNTVRDCTVSGEVVLAMGAGATTLVTGNTVTGSIFDRGAGMTTATISHNTVNGSIVDTSGGHSDGREDEIIEANTVVVPDGGEVGIESRGKSVTIRNNTVTASTPATGISCSSGAPTNVIGNKVTVPYRASSADPDDGGGAAFLTLSGPGEVSGNEFVGGFFGIFDKSAGAFTNNKVTGAHIGVMTYDGGAWRNNTIEANVGDGLVTHYAGGPFEGNVIRNNGGAGIRVERASAGNPGAVVDLGGGVRGSAGGNTITGNGAYDLVVEAPLSDAATIPAKGNRWDHSADADIAALDILDGADNAGAGSVEFSPHL